MANSVNPIVTGLTNYVEENALPLISKSMLGAKSAGLFNLQTGIKGPSNLHIMDTNVVFGDGSVCSWNPAGSTEFSERLLTPAYLKVNQNFCDKAWLKKYKQNEVRIAAGQKNLPFEQEMTNAIVESVNDKIERMLYFGDSSLSGVTEFDGLIKTLNAASASVVSVSAATGTSAYAFLKAIAKAIPANVKNPVILCSMPVFNEFMQDIVSANLYHYNPENGENEYLLPGTAVKVIGVNGLNAATGDTYDYAIAANIDNIYLGVDGEGDEEKFELWYSQDNREFRLDIEFCMGVQVGIPSEIVFAKRSI